MWLRVFAVFVLCSYSFGDFDFLRLTRIRTKREGVPRTDENLVTEFYNDCSCVYNYQCDPDGFIITTGKGLFNIRLGQDGPKRILCSGSNVTGEFVCCKHKLTTIKPENKSCGMQLPNTNVRIFAGENELTPVNGEFPWLVAIFKNDSGTQQWKFDASGSLIHPRVILTANHVVVSTEPSNLKVIANGQIELSKIGNNPLQERNVIEIINHPQYGSKMLFNDVALLILEADYNVSVTTSVNTLCLKPNLSFENKRCLVAGWGKTANNTNETIKELKKVELPTHSHSKCREMLAKALAKSNFRFHESHMCAGGEQGKDASKGDGGSPLMCPTNAGDNSMYQVGMVAWGLGRGKKDVPGVYVNVQFLHTWIVEQLKKREINI